MLLLVVIFRFSLFFSHGMRMIVGGNSNGVGTFRANKDGVRQ